MKSTYYHCNNHVDMKKLDNQMHEKDSKRCCDTTTPESFHTKDESKRGIAFALIFSLN